MNNTLSEREQQYYLAVFRAKFNIDFSANNALRLFQLVDVHCKTSNEYNASHKQPCEEITFVYGGEGEMLHNGKKHKVKSGDIHVCFKDDHHQVFPSRTSPLRFYCIGFSLDERNPLYTLVRQARAQFCAGKSPVINECFSLQPAFRAALSELYSGECDEVSQAAVANSLNYIIYSTYSRFLNRADAGSDNIPMTGNLLFYIISYLKNNVYHIDALHTLSKDIGYSYGYLSHLFSSQMGQSLKNFFAALRMSEATELLKSKSVTEVSDILGYSSIHAFTRAYKLQCGETPGDAKKKMQSPNEITQYL